MKKEQRFLKRSLSCMAAASAGLMMLFMVACNEESLPDTGNGNIIGFTLGTEQNEGAFPSDTRSGGDTEMLPNNGSTRGTRIITDNLDENYDKNIGVRSFSGTDFYFDNVLNYEANHRWRTSDTYYWPSSTVTLDFWAWAPKTLATGKGTRDDISAKIDNIAKTVTFNYTMQAPDATNKKDAENQPDLLFAYTAAKMTDYNGNVPLYFKHALAAIRFKIEQTDTMTVQTISLNNIYSAGSCTFSATTQAFAWTNADDSKKTFIQTFNEYFLQKSGTFFEMGASNDATTFLVVPQTLSSTVQSLSVVFQRTGKSNTETFTASFPSTNTSWEAGKLYTYKISLDKNPIDIKFTIAPWVDGGNTEIDY